MNSGVRPWNIRLGSCVGDEVAGAEQQEISTTRKGAAALSLITSGGTICWEAMRHVSPDWIVIAFGGLLAAAGVALTRPSLIGQTLARGAAWITLVPMALATGAQLYDGKMPGFTELALTGTTCAALALARPMLDTRAARAAFDPHRFRRIFLAGSTATAAAAFLTGGIALETLAFRGIWAGGIGFVILTVALLATAIGVVRMRAWGILLGAATSVALLGAAAVTGGEGGVFLALLAAPMLVLHMLPILFARMRADGPAPAPSRYRVASDSAPSRVRVQLDDELVAADGEDELPRERCNVHV